MAISFVKTDKLNESIYKVKVKTRDSYGTWNYSLTKMDGEWMLHGKSGGINNYTPVIDILPDLKTFYNNGKTSSDIDDIVSALEDWLSSNY